MNWEELTVKKKKLNHKRPLPPDLIKNLEEWYKVELTYTSNAIEGNTLTRQETALVIEKGLTVGGKSLVEHLEATNHAAALDFIQQLVTKKSTEITEKDILDIHHIILKNIDNNNAGRYRNVAVRIAGSEVIMPNPAKISALMQEFMQWLKNNSQEHPAKMAADAHFRLVTIHPFIDGNGRTARLLMNLILMQNEYIPAIIRAEDRLKYIRAVEKGQLTNQLDDYYEIIYKAVDRSLDIYLDAVKNSSND